MFFVFKYNNSKKNQKQKIHICYFHFFFSYFQILFFKILTLILINESITMLGYSIQSSEINCSSISSFLHTNVWHFEQFVFNFWFRFSLSALQDFLPKAASTHLSHLPDVVLKFSDFGQANTFLIPGTRLILLITIIFNPFDLLYLLLENGFCVRVTSTTNKYKYIQGSPSRFYSSWVCCWQKINNIYASFRVIIYQA